jgi:hypothetical protein
MDEFRELGRKFTIDCDAICDALVGLSGLSRCFRAGFESLWGH